MAPSGNANRPLIYFDLVNACGQQGCPVCRLSAHSVRHYLDGLFYELVNDPGARDNLLKSRGFCTEHAGLLLRTRIADALGASIIYGHILKNILEDLPKPSASSSSNPGPSKDRTRLIGKFMKASAVPVRCPACEQRETASNHALDGLGKSLHDEKLRLALQGSDGLCFPHLTRLLERLESPEDLRFVLDLTRDKLEALQAQMAELVRKNDYRFQSEGITESEGLAWRKAMSLISGAGYDPLDAE
jgi:Family of unknown function (DUF6062)